MQMKKKKKTKLFIFLIICFVLVPFLLTKGCNMESLNQAKNSVFEPITSISEQIQHSASAHSHIHKRAHNAQLHSIRKANWSGTAVPTSGYVGNVYFNKSLSDDEIFNTLNQLTFVSEPSFGTDSDFYVVAVNEAMSKGIVIYKNKIPEGYIGFAYFDDEDFIEIWYSNYTWWYPNDFVELNVDSIQNILGAQYNVDVAAQNELIKNVISITPFEQDASNELSIGNLFAQLANAILLFGVAIVELFLALEPIFWNDGPTLIFILLIAGVAFALASWGLELLISLIGVFRKKRKKKKWRLRK